MELTKQYKNGLLKLAALLGLLCFFIMLSNWWTRSESSFVLNEAGQCFVANQELILAEAQSKKNYTYYVNSITDYSGYRLGLSLEEIDNLFAYRKKGNKIYNLDEFKKVSKIESAKLDSIKQLLVFPKYRPKTKLSTRTPRSSIDKKNTYDINKVTSGQLYSQLGLPSVIANRIVKYRESLKGYKSMKQLENVYDITEEQLSLLNSHYKVMDIGFLK